MTGRRVRILAPHPRAGRLATIRGRYSVNGGFWALVDGGQGLETVVRPGDFEPADEVLHGTSRPTARNLHRPSTGVPPRRPRRMVLP